MIHPSRKKILIALVIIVILYVTTLPIVVVQETRFVGEVPPYLHAYAQSSKEANTIDLQLNLDDAKLNFQGTELNATSARITVKGAVQPDGSVKLDLSLDLKNLSVKSPDIKAKIASGVMAGSLLVSKDNKLVANLQTKTSVMDILRSILGI